MGNVLRARGTRSDQAKVAPSDRLRDDAIGAHYDKRKMAAGYAKLYQGTDAVARFLNSRLHVVSQALADVPKGELLDVGCGPGVFVRRLLDSRPGDFAITAVDRSPAMVEECIARIAGDRTAKALVARSEALPFESDRFDVVLAMGVLEYAQATAALAEISRVTRPHGRVIVTMHNPHSPYRTVERFAYRPIRQVLRMAKSLVRSGSFAGALRGGVELHTFPARKLRSMMEDAGLRPVETVYYDVTFTVPPLDRIVRRWSKGWRNNLERTVGRNWWKRFGTAYMTVASKPL